MASYLDQSIAKLEQFEGVIPWMYLDTAGKVTTGVGLMLPSASGATRLPFQINGRAATQEEISAEYARVDALPMGRPALFYRTKDAHGPELPRPQIDSLLRTVLAGFDGELRKALPDYDTIPDAVKLALLDMMYNLGPAGLIKGYPHLMTCVAAGNWAQAAAGCYRHGPGAERNEWTRQQFLANVVSEVKAALEGRWKRFGFGLLGISVALLEKVRGRK